VRYREPDAQLDAWARRPAVGSAGLWAGVSGFFGKTLVIVELELRKLWHDPVAQIVRSFQPLLWLLIFGQVFARTRAIPTGNLPYIAFLAPGIIAQTALGSATLYGTAIIAERDLGIIHKFLASPMSRTALILGKALAAGMRCLPQAIVIYVVSVFLGVRVDLNPLAIIGVLMAVLLGASFFAALAMCIACVVKTRERFLGLSQMMIMPLFFASNAIYPLSIMPGWLNVISRVNPVTYQVDALRALMVVEATSTFGVAFDLGILAVMTLLLVVVSGRLCPRLAY